MMRRRWLFSGVAAVVGIMGAGEARAQAASGEVAARDDEVVVVTAQRREQRLQDVPLAVSAVSGASLREAGVANATDLGRIAPSVSYGTSANSRGEGLQVRGVGTQIFGDGVEQSVGVVIDGIPMGRNGMGIGEMADVERIEVLRGPQGMLFGKNASAGLINVITAAPKPGETSLLLRGSYATLEDISASATANLSLGEDAALRLVWQSRTREGYVDNIARNEKLNGLENVAVRARFLADVTEKLRVQLFADTANSNTTCCTWTARAAPVTTPFGALNAAAGIVPSPTNLRNAAGARFFQDMDNWGVGAQVDYDLDWATLTAIAGFRNWYAVDNNDPDILPVNILDVNAGDSEVDQTTVEVRLTSPGGRRLEWTLGLFTLDMSNTGGNVQAGTLGQPLPPGFTIGADRRSTTVNASDAIFGQIAYTFAERLTLSLGARYTAETLSVEWSQKLAAGSQIPIPGRFYGATTGKRDTSNVSWRFTAQYDVTPDIMVYAGAARGYKGPAYDQGLVNSTVVFTKSEIPTSIEAGLRSTWLDNRLLLNAALFHTEFKDFQAQVFDQNVFPSRFTTANAGALETQGLELEFRFRPFEGFSVSGNLALIEATYTDFKDVACYAGQTQLPFGTVRTSPRQCIRIISATGPFVTEATGNPLTNSPETAGNVVVAYERPLGAVTGFAQASYAHRGAVSFSAAGDPGARQEAYGLLGARIGVRDPDDRWSLTVFGRNLLDENFVNNVIGQPVLGAPGVYSQFPNAEARRIFGVTLEWRFGG
jgi:iron complex outermembrane receptor protein